MILGEGKLSKIPILSALKLYFLRFVTFRAIILADLDRDDVIDFSDFCRAEK